MMAANGICGGLWVCIETAIEPFISGACLAATTIGTFAGRAAVQIIEIPGREQLYHGGVVYQVYFIVAR